MEFAGKNQIASETEELRFALSTEVKDKGSAALNGVPIFLGVSVGQDGIAFEGRTINVKSNVDDALIKALRGETFQRGLSLLTSAQPALKPFVGLATNVVNSVVSRSQNRQIHSFKLGLDFGSGSTSARLREGSYIVVQADVATWDWSEVVCNSNSQALLYKSTKKPIEFNYLIFGVATFAG
jgi:hypothetical protein